MDHSTDNRANDRKSIGTFVSSMLIFGTIGVLRRYIPFSSALLAFSRGILGGLFLFGFVKIGKRGDREKLPGRVLARLIVTGALIGINWMLLFEAYNHTTVAVATLCYYMEPTIIILLSPFVFKERLTGKRPSAPRSPSSVWCWYPALSGKAPSAAAISKVSCWDWAPPSFIPPSSS